MLPISASQVARITGENYQRLAHAFQIAYLFSKTGKFFLFVLFFGDTGV
jgi:hypothetical protein